MYYVNDVSLLQDEMTRYHYFLQLKSDVMEGRLRCSYNEAIVLAGYRLQGKFLKTILFLFFVIFNETDNVLSFNYGSFS